MKVLIYGRETLVSKVTPVLVQHGIEAVEILDHPDALVGLQHLEKPDLALLDRKVEDAAMTCRDIRKLFGIPVVLVMGRDNAEWEGLDGIQASGYIPDTFRNGELVAHLHAIYRRTTQASKGVAA